MANNTPTGVTPVPNDNKRISKILTKQLEKLSSPEELSQVTKALERFEKTTREYEGYQKSIQSEIALLKEAGATKKDMRDYIDSVVPLFDERTEMYEKEIENVDKDLRHIYEGKEFSDIKQHQALQKILGTLDRQLDEEKETAKKTNEWFKNLADEFGKYAETTGKNTANAFLGPLRLITEPFEEFTGFNFVDSISAGFSDIFSKRDDEDKKKKIPPKRTQMLKEGIEGSSAVYIVDELKKQLGKEEDAGLLDDTFGDFFKGGIGKFLGTSLSIAAIAAGIIWAVVDAIAAWGMAEEWGVSNISAAIGGFLGGTSSGWEGAFANAGKWALIGVGIGFLAGGPVGAIAGGLIGAAIGGILGFIGGENIAKGIQAVADWFVSIWESVVDFFTNNPLGQFISELFMSIWNFVTEPFVALWETIQETFNAIMGIWQDEDKSLLDKILGTLWEVLQFPYKLLGNVVQSLWDGVTNFFADLFIGTKDAEGKRTKKSLVGMGWGLIKDLASNAFAWLGEVFTGIFNEGVRIITGIGSFFGDIASSIGNFFGDLFSGVGQAASSTVDFIGDFLDQAIFGPLTAMFGFLWEGPDSPLNAIGKFLDEWIIQPLSGLFNFIGAQIQKVTLGIALDEEKSRTMDILGEKGVDTSSLISFVEQGNIEGYDWWNRTDILKEENRGDLMDALRELGYEDVEVQDAIITSRGDIVQLDTKDNIIATQNMPTKLDKSFMNQMNALYGDGEGEDRQNEVVELLSTIAQILREKKFNNVIQTNLTGDPFNFDKLRMAEN